MTTLRGNVIAILALVVAMAGTAYAGTQLPAGSVGTKQLKKAAVTTKKIQDGAVTGSKINLSTLGTVPSADKAALATNALKLQGHPASDFALAGALHNVTVVHQYVAPSGLGFRFGFAQCPAGQKALGGGVNMSGGVTGGHYMYIMESSHVDFNATTQGWYGAVNMVAGTNGWYVSAICAQQ